MDTDHANERIVLLNNEDIPVPEWMMTRCPRLPMTWEQIQQYADEAVKAWRQQLGISRAHRSY